MLHDYHARADDLRTDDRDGWLSLAKWSSSQGLNTQARQAYLRVLALEPDQADANLALGRVLLDGRWVTEEESYRSRGFLAFEGQWLTPAEQEAVLRQRDATRQAELGRLEAEWRAREAEARAREAEAAAARSAASIPVGWGGWGWGVPAWQSQPAGVLSNRRSRPTHPLGVWPYSSLGVWPSQQLGLWPAEPLGLWPSYPIGVWPFPAAGQLRTPPGAVGTRGQSPSRQAGPPRQNAPPRPARRGKR